MTDIHNKSFFGSSVGMILDSTSKTEQKLFLTFLRKKQDGSWEKPSNNEGKKISINLEELVWILEVLKHKIPDWSTIHKFEDTSTSISISWEKGEKEQTKLSIQVDGYKKYLNHAESILLTRLLDHILEEKITFSTVPFQRESSSDEITSNKEEEGLPIVVEEISIPKKKGVETHLISGSIKGETDKALRILFDGEKEIWIPKSTIHSSYSSDSDKPQTFNIDTWILKKNDLIK